MGIEYTGIFWLPKFENNGVFGNLSIAENGDCTLYALSQLYETEKKPRHKFSEFDVVIGKVIDKSNNKYRTVILYRVYQTMSSIGNFDTVKYFSNMCLVGDNIFKDNDLHYKDVYFYSESLHDIVRNKGFDYDFGKSNKGLSFTLKYKQPKTIELYKKRNIKVYLYFRSNCSMDALGKVDVLEKPYLNVEFIKSEHDLAQILRFRQKLERFLMILWEKPHRFEITDLKSVGRNNYSLIDNRELIKTPNRVSVELNDFTSKFSSLWDNWGSTLDYLDDVISSFFFAYSDYRLDVTNRFLNIVFAIEQYHRRTVQETLPLSKQNERMYNKVLAELKSGDTKSWLEKVLNTERNIPLKSRLNDLIEIQKTILEISEQEILTKDEIEKVEITRNYHVHIDKKKENKAYKSEELVRINEKLSILFFTLLKYKQLKFERN